ncbi:outer membrane protein assembly factor BamB [Microbulbifer thermotolerans]|uniref:Outer membrane protein assembly factor BamB n=1 Tax=Microbulbifer thermotolerans TaxID=252514 RepID=A0A143HNM0_MICTH|nr:outer membrane protein assembly factor BamB [Microbulbifer thermotolerans]AMX03086.1 outer membrane protein assembly factor BamB [Microbulbifer thermotolerans]MCX2784371.1 outer membrane protein assembly factor BamB [Microbulbifer thermotolerans]MCX2795997.1 outer membrane protein assembly factor BamB [Microbulbifer thermotolerans]MCX2801886.1 outer membrane protein assembly factor BamB [Microbulbifer thermotolerans]MCX2831470.1 outer membrane protein assembly factor BamB [Microbulbifer the
MSFLSRAAGRAAAVALAVVLAACASNEEKEDTDPVELVDITTSVDLKEVWSRNIGDIDATRYAMLQPAVSAGKLVVANSEGEVIALERNTGRRLWETDLEIEISGGVGVGLGMVVVIDYRGRAVALNLEDGAELWTYQVSGEVVSVPAIGAGVVVLQTVDGKLLGLDATSGGELWTHNTVLPVLTLRGTASPVIVGGTVIAGLDNGKLIALDARDGIPRWEQRVAIPQGSAELDRVVDIDGAPVVRGDLVFAASYQGRVVALSREDGRGLWARDASTHQSVAVGAGNVYLSDAGGSVYAYNVGNGQIVWNNNELLRRELSAPAYFSDVLVVGDLEGYLHVLDPANGHFIGRKRIDGDPVRIPMLVDGDLLFALSDGGELVALRLERH